jgi:hypothetical protein
MLPFTLLVLPAGLSRGTANHDFKLLEAIRSVEVFELKSLSAVDAERARVLRNIRNATSPAD